MYEPYGEEKKGFNLKEKIAHLKEKIQGKFKSLNIKGPNTENLKFSKVTITVFALSLLLVVGSITSYVSKTGQVKEVEANNMILQKQNDACQSELNNANQQLSICSSNIETIQSDLTKMTLDYQTTQANFQVCNEEKLTLSSDLNMVNEELKKIQTNYDKIKGSYNELMGNYDTVTCNYAKNTCGSGGMNYYYLDDDEKIVCCLNEDICARDPNGKDVKKIEC